MRFGLWYDFRNPQQWRRPIADIYAETFGQIRQAEHLGYDDIWTTEHHFVDDDYSPSLLPICAGIAMATSRVGIGTNLLLLPLHDPVRIAEDAATVDVMSGGRFSLGVGLGYRRAEFVAMGIPTSQRGQRMDEALQVLRAAWSPAAVNFAGDFYRYRDADVTPKPVQPTLPLLVGGLTEIAARRAARLGTGFLAGAGPNLVPTYADECRRLGQPVGDVVKGLPFHAVADDPDAAWARIAPHLHYQRARYVDWLNEAGTEVWPAPASPDDIRAMEPDVVVTPGRAVEIVQDLLASQPEITHLYWNPALPGIPAADSHETLELFATRVMPALRG